MDNTVKYVLIGGGVLVGGFVLYRVLDMALSPASTPALTDNVSPNPAVPADAYGRRGESDATAIGRVFERAIDRIGEGYVTYTREVSQTNRQRTAAAANDAAARQAKEEASRRLEREARAGGVRW